MARKSTPNTMLGASEKGRRVVTGELSLSERIVSTFESVRVSVRPVVVAFTGTTLRPAILVRSLGIDQTLAARVVRVLKSPDVTEVIHEFPSPEGLRILLAAAARVKPDAPLQERALACIDAYERLLADVPGGRAGLDMIAADWSPATRVRAENSARQAVFKSMSSLMGFFAEQTLETAIIRPSAGSDRACDTVFVLGKYGIRRLRPGGRITVYGRQVGEELLAQGMPGRSLTISGEKMTCADDGLLTDYCSKPIPEMHLTRRPGVELNVLPEGVPAVNEPVSIVGAHLVRGSGVRPLCGDDRPWDEGFVSRLPSKFLLFDVLVEEGTFPHDPMLTSTLFGFTPSQLSPDSDTFRLDEVSLTGKIERLERGLPDLECAEIPGYAAMIGQVFQKSGWDRSRFIGYRFKVRYPVPLVRLTYWFFGGPRDARADQHGSGGR